MLTVCSATPSCSSHSQISLHVGLRGISPLRKATEDRCILENKALFGVPHGFHTKEISCKTRAMKFLYVHVAERCDQSGPVEFTNITPHTNKLDNIVHRFSDEVFYNEPQKTTNGSYPTAENLHYVESSTIPGTEELLLGDDGFGNAISNDPRNLGSLDSASSVSDTIEVTDDALSKLKENIEHLLSGVSGSIDTSVDKANSAVKDTYYAITSSLTDKIRSVTGSFENAVSGLLSSTSNVGEKAGSKLAGFANEFKESAYKAGAIAVDVLRRGIVSVEDSLANTGTFVIYSYGSAKALLPPEIRNALNSSEERTVEVLRPVGTAFQQVYVVIEGLEKDLGLDPSDPIIPFALFLISSATLGITYWVLKYGGYSGDLSPKSTLELLTKEENAVLIDVRPEDLRERDGVPDIRRGARFRYASVQLPEIDGSVRKLLKNGRSIDDALVAAVIRNLKVVQDRSKVIVMDANGDRSKAIARSLRKLGVERPYLVQGGFLSWMKDGLRIKELKPETTFTILNEDAEAILEEIRPTPPLVIGYGVGFVAAIYALLEWEKTLQFIGIIGLGQTICRRIATYEDSEDFKQDVRLLLAPVKLGAEAFSWAAGKLEPNKIGLPTSPSSSAVQNRVLQAAAKHESQPSDPTEPQDPSRDSTSPTGDNLDLSEA